MDRPHLTLLTGVSPTMARSYLVRFGLARSVALFGVDNDSASESLDLECLERGDWVVVRTHRGTELGEVLSAAPAGFDPTTNAIPQTGRHPETALAPLLRRATAADREQAERAEARRGRDYEAAAAVFAAGPWPIDLIDAEPLLDESRTVLHYLGPHRFDAADLIATLRNRCTLDAVLEPVGLDEEEVSADDAIEVETLDLGCGSCGSSGGSCGSCSSASGCAVRELVGKRQSRRSTLIP